MIVIGMKLRHKSMGEFTVEWISGEYCGLAGNGITWTGPINRINTVGFEVAK